nr:MAG TPA: hypothetical protein [Caudoviricetes sp.]DAM06026.1 MAG TPA: hypothetical protein [Caudoviricetes sp.]
MILLSNRIKKGFCTKINSGRTYVFLNFSAGFV